MRVTHASANGGVVGERIGRARVEHDEAHRWRAAVPDAREPIAIQTIIRDDRARLGEEIELHPVNTMRGSRFVPSFSTLRKRCSTSDRCLALWSMSDPGH